MIFRFVTQRLGFLKNVPLLPHIFDSFLKLQLFFTHRQRIDLMDDIRDEILSWPGMQESFHKYGGIQFNFQNSELGHIHGNGLIDIHLNKQIAQKMISEGKVLPHHILKNTGWISFYLKRPDDLPKAIQLYHTAYLLRTKCEI